MTMRAVDLQEEQSCSNFDETLVDIAAHKRCYACALREHMDLQRSGNKLDPDVLGIHGKTYHRHDFVYLRMPSKQRNLLVVAQIVDLLPLSEKPDLQVSIFDRAQYMSDEEPTPRLEVRSRH